MWTKYALRESRDDCFMTFKLPFHLFEKLSVRAKVLGRDFETELKLRLARSLFADELRDRTDELLEAIYYSEET